MINIQLYTLVIWQYTWYVFYLVADIEYLDTNVQSKNNENTPYLNTVPNTCRYAYVLYLDTI